MYLIRQILVHIRRHQWVTAGIIGVVIGWMIGISFNEEPEEEFVIPVGRSWSVIETDDTLRIATSRECADLFVHKQHWIGHDFEITSSLTRHLGLQMDFYCLDSVSALFDHLKEGTVDVLLMSARRPHQLPDWTMVANEFDSVQWVVLRTSDTLTMRIDSVCRHCQFFPVHVRPDSIRNLARKARMRNIVGEGVLSPYDSIFKKNAKGIGWDWRLLASVAYCESHFNNDCVSPKGALGLMQMMPATAAVHGCSPEGLVIPDSSIMAGTSLLFSLEGNLRSRIANTKKFGHRKYISLSPEEQVLIETDLLFYTLASYNAGMGHIYDAIALADSLGYDPSVWKDNVEHCLRLKNDVLYTDIPGVRCGKFNSSATRSYIQNVLETYEDFGAVVKL